MIQIGPYRCRGRCPGGCADSSIEQPFPRFRLGARISRPKSIDASYKQVLCDGAPIWERTSRNSGLRRHDGYLRPVCRSMAAFGGFDRRQCLLVQLQPGDNTCRKKR
jgi:hypothetical protein